MTVKTKNELVQKWEPLLENEKLPEIAQGKKAIVAKILEQQEQASKTDKAFRDKDIVEAFGDMTMTEATVGGDHGYNAANIAAGQTSGAVANVGPAVMGLLRRAVPNLIAFDVAGVQPLTNPTGQIFSMRATYGKNALESGAKEAFHPMYAPDAMYSGRGAQDGKNFKKAAAGLSLTAGDIVHHVFEQTGVAYLQATDSITLDAGATDAAKLDAEVLKQMQGGKLAELAEGMATSFAELQEGFNGSTDNPWNEMGFRIDKQTIEAKSRQLKAQYTIELAQDLRAVHGMDADAELQNILATEIMLEINREMVDWINYTAQVGKSGMTLAPGAKAGVFDFQDQIDVKGARWAGESFKSLLFQIDKEAAEIARQTGRGAGNFIIASRNVVNALAAVDSGVSMGSHGMASALNTDTTKSVFAGILGGRYKVYIDQYARYDYFTVGYKGDNEMDAGIYYAPYVSLTPLRGTDPDSLQPILGFKTRYAIGLNPFADAKLQAPAGRVVNATPLDAVGKNGYFRRVAVVGL